MVQVSGGDGYSDNSTTGAGDHPYRCTLSLPTGAAYYALCYYLVTIPGEAGYEPEQQTLAQAG